MEAKILPASNLSNVVITRTFQSNRREGRGVRSECTVQSQAEAGLATWPWHGVVDITREPGLWISEKDTAEWGPTDPHASLHHYIDH